METEKDYKRHKRIYHFLQPIVNLYLRMKFGFRRPKLAPMNGPFLLIANHVTDYDMLFAAVSIKEHMYFVGSEHTMQAGFASRLLAWTFDPIIRKKASSAAATVMEMRRRLKHGQNVCLFAEGERSGSGVNRPMVGSTAAVARKMGCQVATFRIHGGYFTSPRWGDTLRRGRMTGELVHIYSPEELQAMTVEEVNNALNADIHEDAYARNAEEKIAFKGKRLAEHIEFQLIACPKCGGLNTLKSKGNEFSCPCGLHGTYDEYGLLHGEGFSFTTITEWSNWCRQHIANLPDYPEDTVLCRDDDQTLTILAEDHTKQIVDTGTLTLTPAALTLGNTRLPLAEMGRCDLIRHGYLLINMADGRYLEIKDPEHKFAGYLYLLLIDRFCPGKVNL